jgi:hypothetical protein
MRTARDISQNAAPLEGIRSWVDNCLVPILANEYLREGRKTVATEADSVAHSAGEVASHAEVNQ